MTYAGVCVCLIRAFHLSWKVLSLFFCLLLSFSCLEKNVFRFRAKCLSPSCTTCWEPIPYHPACLTFDPFRSYGPFDRKFCWHYSVLTINAMCYGLKTFSQIQTLLRIIDGFIKQWDSMTPKGGSCPLYLMVVFENKCSIKTVYRTNIGRTEMRSVIVDLDIRVKVIWTILELAFLSTTEET
jgi:hypothetical protein